MALEKADKIWMNGKLIPWDEAKVHVLSHVLHYASALFEGMRCYSTRKGPAVFRLAEHVRRLFDSCRIYRTEIPFTQEQIRDGILETIRTNRLEACYVRPIVFRGYNTLGVDPSHCPVETVIAVWRWGAYLGKDALEKGVDVKVSSWRRMAPDTMPSMAKSASNYMNSQLIKLEANTDGYAEGIALDAYGYISEGSGENIFLIRDGVVFTPPLSAAVLPGITRDSAIRILSDFGHRVVETNLSRESLYTADEIFFTGSAAEVTPIRSVDRIPVGDGDRPITRKLQAEFFALTTGEKEDRYGWLTPVQA
jgi:branched-chain amino acid aminotransferase